jgi:dipeptidyl aminopeptidase/acylaminoacyl peptidase
MTAHVLRRTHRVLLAALCGFLATPLAAQDSAAPTPLTPEDVARLAMATNVELSPDGRLIAYTRSVQRRLFDEEDGPAWSHLHVVDLEGRDRPFVTGEVNVSSIRWTPDGRGIAFLAKRGKDEHTALYVIPVDGGEARRVRAYKEDIPGYALSPDGKRVAFIATEPESKERKERKEKGFKAEVFEEEDRPVRVFIAPLDDADAEASPLDLPGTPSELHWCPTAPRIAVALAPTPSVDDELMNRRLRVFDVDGGALVAKFDNPGKLGRVRWSPDGKRLAIISGEDIHDPAEGRLMIATLADGSLRDILPNYEGHVESIAWQNDETVMYLGDEGVHTVFAKINADGTGRKTIVPAERPMRGLSLSADGLAAAVVSSGAAHPSEVFVMGHGDPTPRRLTDHNPWLAQRRFAKQEVIAYRARDGLELQGILIRPLDEQPGTRYPLILSVHGGPEAHEQDGWLTSYGDPGQVGAARGFAVFNVNYRGSTGRGVAFSKLSQGDFAGKEFDDLVDGVDHLIAAGVADRERVGITGGSYGGYATAWCTTRYSERFAAGVMFVGLSDMISDFNTSDIPQEAYLVHLRRYPWDDWQLFLERSPIFHAEKARTPLLIMHGTGDTRVDTSQSLEMFRVLKTLGKTPVRFVTYPGEGHGNRRAAARYDYSLRMLRWFEHYLKGPGGPPPPTEIEYPAEPAPTREEEQQP